MDQPRQTDPERRLAPMMWLAGLAGQIRSTDLRLEMAKQLTRATSADGVRATNETRTPAPLDDSIGEADLVSQLVSLQSTLAMGEQRAIARQTLQNTEDFAVAIKAERLRQAKRSFNLAMTLASLGVILVFFTAAATVWGSASSAVISSVSAGISEIVAVLLFRLNKQTNDRLDELQEDTASISKLRITMSVIEGIADQRTRERATLQALRTLEREHAPRRSVTQGRSSAANSE